MGERYRACPPPYRCFVAVTRPTAVPSHVDCVCEPSSRVADAFTVNSASTRASHSGPSNATAEYVSRLPLIRPSVMGASIDSKPKRRTPLTAVPDWVSSIVKSSSWLVPVPWATPSKIASHVPDTLTGSGAVGALLHPMRRQAASIQAVTWLTFSLTSAKTRFSHKWLTRVSLVSPVLVGPDGLGHADRAGASGPVGPVACLAGPRAATQGEGIAANGRGGCVMGPDS